MAEGIDIVVMRHAEKMQSNGYPGGDDDLWTMLTSKGIEESMLLGAKILRSDYDHVEFIASPFVRTQQTGMYMLYAAGYPPADPVVYAQYPTKLSPHGWNWRMPDLPKISEHPDAWARTLLELYFMPHSDNILSDHPLGWPPPVAASMAEQVVETVQQGLSNSPAENALVLVVTHAGYMDAFANALLPNNMVAKQQQMVLQRFPGAFGTGEYITGQARGTELTLNIKAETIQASREQLARFTQILALYAKGQAGIALDITQS